jgi:2-amino-4-hydroxy-6-hydroxymethyldihydropteridine diphosphokinase
MACSTQLTHRCAIALGSNLGDSLATLEAALAVLASITGIDLITRSPWYQTKAVGPPQPDYLNGCALLQVTLTPHQLMDILLEIEAAFGRIRQGKWQPRTLDLDMLLFDDVILDTPHLQIPHPRMTQRAFVLIPLADIASDWIEPISGESIATLRNAVNCSNVNKLMP